MKHRTDPAGEFARLEAALKASIGRVANGDSVDASALARDIEALCEQLVATPAGGGRQHAVDLKALLDGLSGLEAALREQCGEFDRRIALLAPEAPGDR